MIYIDILNILYRDKSLTYAYIPVKPEIRHKLLIMGYICQSMERGWHQGSFGGISYLRRKGKIPLLMIHGFTASGKIWEEMAEYLDPVFDVICPDLFGHGETPLPELKNMADGIMDMPRMLLFQEIAINDLLKSLGIKDFYLVGSSMGGWISMELAANYARPKKLVLIDSAGTASLDDLKFKNGLMELVSGFHEGESEQWELLKSVILSSRPEDFQVNKEILDSLDMPVSVIWGEKDWILDPSFGSDLSGKLKNSSFRIIEGGDHTPFVTHPGEAASIINKFLLGG